MCAPGFSWFWKFHTFRWFCSRFHWFTMATLDDQFLSGKSAGYCSSSSDEEEVENEDRIESEGKNEARPNSGSYNVKSKNPVLFNFVIYIVVNFLYFIFFCITSLIVYRLVRKALSKIGVVLNNFKPNIG